MKFLRRIAGLILSLIMLVSLVPFGVSVSAESIKMKEFYMINSASFDFEVPYIYYMPIFESAGFVDLDSCCQAYGTTMIEDIAAEMKDDFDNRPAGTRYFQFKLFREALYKFNEDVVYWDKAVEVTKDWLTAFLKEYKRIGGKLDGILMDVEYEHIVGTYIYRWVYEPAVNPSKAGNVRNGVPANKNIYKDIVNDPRYATEIRPMLVERGFKFWENPAGYSPSGNESEIWTINDGFSLNKWLKTDKYWGIWLNVMNLRMSDAVNEAVFDPLQEYYPGAVLSDYQMSDGKSWLKHLSQYASPGGLNSSKVGNTSNYNVYNYGVNDSVPGNTTPVGYNKAVFDTNPFNMTLWDVNMFKKMYEATDTGLVNAWIAGYNNPWGRGKKLTNCNTPYYTETMFHMGLMNMNPSFIGYIVGGEEMENFETSMWVVSDILRELTSVAGASDRKVIPTPVSWNGGYVLSGMYAGGRNIWRITPNTELVSLEDFKVKDKAPTFSCDGQTIVFPQGRIIEDGDVRQVGTCGYWVETPANVMPVITSTADRYAKYPAFEENFQQYTVGATLSSATAYWKTTGDPKVTTQSGNKMLALTGTSSAQNVKVTELVTAGDSYARQQAWEVTFTLPNNLTSGAALYLLRCGDDDGGIKIANGKMYYDQNGTYKELSGVSLSAGTYTVKREVDFRTEGAYKSSYSIYGSNGSLIKDVKNVPMVDVEVLDKVADRNSDFTIEIACENVTGDILIDNYKLYPTGVTTEFELYDTEIGLKLTDLTQARTKDTAYRLAWMNATNENKVAYVYNTKNNAVIQKVEMPAGQDGVITGVVKASAGSAVQLAVRTENGAATTLPNYDNGDFSWPTMEENIANSNYSGEPDPTIPPETDPDTVPTTAPTTPPTTAPTTPSTTPDATEPSTTPDATDPSTAPDVTEPSTTPETTEPSTAPDATEPSTTPDATEPSTTPDATEPDTGKGLTGGQIAWIVVGCVLVAGGGAAALLYVFKREVFMLAVKKLKALLFGIKDVELE